MSRVALGLGALAGLLLASWPAPASARRVVVFPVDARGVASAQAAGATEALLRRLAALPEIEVMEPERAGRRLGVDLTAQARACEYDVFCLVEVGELVDGQAVLIGHLAQAAGAVEGGLELKLVVLDVARAAITDVILWRISALEEAMLPEALGGAARRLFSAPDAELALETEPADARVEVWGEPLARPPAGAPIPFWSGTYHLRVEAEGHLPRELDVVVVPGSPTRIPVKLEQDPLYTPPRGGARGPERRLGSRASAQTVGAVELEVGPSPAYARPWPWLLAGGGVAGTIAGAVMMSGAQSRYAELSGQPRFEPGKTVTADVAARQREEQRSAHRTGSVVLASGAALVVGAAIWMLVDRLLDAPPPPAKRASVGRGDPLEPAARAAAKSLAAAAGGTR